MNSETLSFPFGKDIMVPYKHSTDVYINMDITTSILLLLDIATIIRVELVQDHALVSHMEPKSLYNDRS